MFRGYQTLPEIFQIRFLIRNGPQSAEKFSEPVPLSPLPLYLSVEKLQTRAFISGHGKVRNSLRLGADQDMWPCVGLLQACLAV